MRNVPYLRIARRTDGTRSLPYSRLQTRRPPKSPRHPNGLQSSAYLRLGQSPNQGKEEMSRSVRLKEHNQLSDASLLEFPPRFPAMLGFRDVSSGAKRRRSGGCGAALSSPGNGPLLLHLGLLKDGQVASDTYAPASRNCARSPSRAPWPPIAAPAPRNRNTQALMTCY
jgi:hypothetical protein